MRHQPQTQGPPRPLSGRYIPCPSTDGALVHSTRAALLLILIIGGPLLHAQEPSRPRARALGVAPGTLATGPLNPITGVAGVRVIGGQPGTSGGVDQGQARQGTNA
jgi:hypothetical protein